MNNKLLIFLLCLCMVVSLLPVGAAAAPNDTFTVQSIDSTPVSVTMTVLTEPAGTAVGTAQVGTGSGMAVDEAVDSVTLPAVVTRSDNGVIKSYSVTDVAEEAFKGCKTGSVNLPAANIQKHAFDACSNLMNVSLINAASIGECAFIKCANLESINLPEAVIIKNGAFNQCEKLKTVSMTNVTNIEAVAFSRCYSLESLDLPKATSIGNSAFNNCWLLESINLPEATNIHDSAFYNCKKLESISLPKVTEILGQTFSGCTSLTNVSLPNVTNIGAIAFENCTSLESMSLPKVTEIQVQAFSGCTSLTNVSLPNVTSIGAKAFENCTSLESMTIWQTVAPAVGNDAFSSVSQLKLYVPQGAYGYDDWPGDKVYLLPVSGRVLRNGLPIENATVSVDGITVQSGAQGEYTVYVMPNRGSTIEASDFSDTRSLIINNGDAPIRGLDIELNGTAKLAFAPASGTYSGAQSISILRYTDGAGDTIRYTTDNTEPCTSSNLYTGAFTIAKTTTVKAGLFTGDTLQGEVVTADYTINTQQHTFGSPITFDSTPIEEDPAPIASVLTLYNGITPDVSTVWLTGAELSLGDRLITQYLCSVTANELVTGDAALDNVNGSDGYTPAFTDYLKSLLLKFGDKSISTDDNSAGETEYQLDKNMLEINLDAVYEISLKSSKNRFSSPLNISFKLNKSFMGQKLTLVHGLKNGDVEYFYGTVDENGVVTFYGLYELSPFLLVKGTLMEAPLASGLDIPQTGDGSHVYALAGVALIACGILLAAVGRGKRRTR